MRPLIGIARTEGGNLLQSIDGRASADGEELIECRFDPQCKARISRQIRAKYLANGKQCRSESPGNRTRLVGKRPQADRERIANVDWPALLVNSRDVAHPGCDAERKPVDRLSLCHPVADGPEQALRQFLRSIHRNLPSAVLQRRIAEAIEQ